jgi:hypothetical protein
MGRCTICGSEDCDEHPDGQEGDCEENEYEDDYYD